MDTSSAPHRSRYLHEQSAGFGVRNELAGTPLGLDLPDPLKVEGSWGDPRLGRSQGLPVWVGRLTLPHAFPLLFSVEAYGGTRWWHSVGSGGIPLGFCRLCLCELG